MDISQLAVRLVVLLFPGIIAALVVEKLTVHKQWDAFRFPLYALVLGAASYVAAQLLWYIVSCKKDVEVLGFWSALDGAKGVLDFKEVLSVTVLGLFLGVFVSAAINKKWFHRAAQHLGITEKYGDESLFYFYLNSPSVAWVRVRLEDDGLMYEGLRESFSENGKTLELLLRNVKVFRLADSVELYSLDAAYIQSSSDKLVIESPTTGGDHA